VRRTHRSRETGSYDVLFGAAFLALAIVVAVKLIPVWGTWPGVGAGVAAPFAVYGALRLVAWVVNPGGRRSGGPRGE
jgi:hypothetical protein